MNYIKVTTTYPTGGTLLPNAFVDNYMIRANGEYIILDFFRNRFCFL